MDLEKEDYRAASFVFIFTALVTSVCLIILRPGDQKAINIYDGFSKVLMVSFAVIAIVLTVLRYNRLVISSIALYFLTKSVTALAGLDKMVNVFKKSLQSGVNRKTRFSIKAYEIFSPASSFILIILTVLLIAFAVIVMFTMFRKPVIPLMVICFFYMVAQLLAEGLYIVNSIKDKSAYKDYWKQNIIFIVWILFECLMTCLACLLTREPFRRERAASGFNPDDDDKRVLLEDYGEIREFDRKD